MQFSVQFSGFPKSGVYDTFWDEKEGEVNQPKPPLKFRARPFFLLWFFLDKYEIKIMISLLHNSFLGGMFFLHYFKGLPKSWVYKTFWEWNSQTANKNILPKKVFIGLTQDIGFVQKEP